MALDLTRKIGPLPLWAWGAAGVVGVGLGVVLRRRGGATGDAEAALADDPYGSPEDLSADVLPVDITGGPPTDTGGGTVIYPPDQPPVVPGPLPWPQPNPPMPILTVIDYRVGMSAAEARRLGLRAPPGAPKVTPWPSFWKARGWVDCGGSWRYVKCAP